MITALIEKFQRKKQRDILNKHPSIFLGNQFKLGINNQFIIYKNIAKFSIGDHVSFRNYIHIILQDKAKLTIGNKVFFNNHCSINCLESISIGENTLFGENVKLYDHNHSYVRNENGLSVSHSEFTTAPIVIGKNCWLGSNVVVLKGVTIGDNCIIGAGCVIHKDIPANSTVLNQQELNIKTY
ncbi:acyltransferase [Frigoriflavimonas asaccharolytica]|uniref:Acetyltransferase-like isoleucine patch superfamily enzyme n=1 Tax=Frigoriflavimonas asaccharolytica TaxID=2735899 RepID=A0A8J8G7L7_9FLAO|nr:acyltransferase [Frigoriflavimonas asaccharolytica]NRS92648.1 acetyltransferase-like isoleucine patch superfamily enzyme [Frigoriflavimonas asaccharolytica]